MEGSGLNRGSTLWWFVKTVRSGARAADGSLPAEKWERGGVHPTLNSFDGGEARATVVVGGVLGAVSHTLTSSAAAEDGSGRGTPVVATALTTRCGNTQDDQQVGQLISSGPGVRRLTPRECERLQGFPDDHTLVPNKRGKLMSDSARYKQMGNAVTVNVIHHIGLMLNDAIDWEGK